MKRNRIFQLSQLVMMTCLAVALTGCREAIGNLFSEPIEPGDEVAFTATTPQRLSTRSDEAPQTLKLPYTLTIGMYKSDGSQEGTNGVYTTTTDDEIGTLKAVTPLYWPSTQVAYGFKAVAGSETLDTDQTTEKKWLAQDRLETLPDSEKVCKTAKEWKKLNESLGLKSDNDDYKKVPLVLYHQRALITVILKAGEGVSAKALYYSAAQKDIHTRICSYGGETPDGIMPLASAYYVDEDSTTRYDAIVAPHDYSKNPATDLITRISLSGQSYSFYAGNDSQFDSDRYNLEAGKHLILTVTLGRNSREVHMTAYIEDWTEEVTNTICDDYGNAGVPIKIKNRDELIDFLKSDEKNKPGNVALVTDNIDLLDWDSSYDLNCTLNLGGKTIISNHRFLKSMADAATLQNGTIQIGGTVDAAVAETNKGAIEDVRVTTSGASAQATAAGVVVHNTGTISKCRSALKVSGGTEGYVGGIAATSLSAEGKIAIIDGCTVTNSVKGGQVGGGIVGKANGYINNNTFEYGITLLQIKETHKNIVGEKQTDHSLTAENNAWPTKDENTGLDNATASEQRYDGIIDSGEELASSTSTTYNSEGKRKRYRLAQDITVQKTTGDVNYELDGNGKTISTSAMIFNAITGKVHDLTVMVTDNLIATPDENAATDAIAALAFEVHGDQAAIERVNVKMANGTKIQASNPAGLVVWVWDGATVSGCEATVNLFADVEAKNITQGRKFAGGLVSTVSHGTVTQCILHSGSTFAGTTSSIIYYGGIVGGIEKKDNSNDKPALTITDCTSFVTMTKDEHHGAILGNAMQAQALATKDCQGNWWDADCNGVGTCTGYSVEQAIGKRNAVTPKE